MKRLIILLLLAITTIIGLASIANIADYNAETLKNIYCETNNSRIFSIIHYDSKLTYEGEAIFIGKDNNTLYFLTAHVVTNEGKYWILIESSGTRIGENIMPLKVVWRSGDLAVISCQIPDNCKNTFPSATLIALPDLKNGKIVAMKNPFWNIHDNEEKILFGRITEYNDFSIKTRGIKEWSICIHLQKDRRLKDILGFSGNAVWQEEKLAGLIWAADACDNIYAIPASVIRKRISLSPLPQSLKDELLR